MTDRFDEMARKLWFAGDVDDEDIATALRAQHRAGQEAMRERAAKIGDEEGAEWDSDNLQTFKNYAAHTATRIRALPIEDTP